MKFNFEGLQVYQLTVKLIKIIYAFSAKLPKHEEYVLKPQLLRAVNSVALNIAEGSGRKSKKDFARFVRISIGSLQETSTILKLLLDLKEINKNDFGKSQTIIQEIFFKLIKLEKVLKR